MNIKIIFASLVAALSLAFTSCDDGKTYAELLQSEDQ